jgi:hypothetical protein
MSTHRSTRGCRERDAANGSVSSAIAYIKLQDDRRAARLGARPIGRPRPPARPGWAAWPIRRPVEVPPSRGGLLAPGGLGAIGRFRTGVWTVGRSSASPGSPPPVAWIHWSRPGWSPRSAGRAGPPSLD